MLGLVCTTTCPITVFSIEEKNLMWKKSSILSELLQFLSDEDSFASLLPLGPRLATSVRSSLCLWRAMRTGRWCGPLRMLAYPRFQCVAVVYTPSGSHATPGLVLYYQLTVFLHVDMEIIVFKGPWVDIVSKMAFSLKKKGFIPE